MKSAKSRRQLTLLSLVLALGVAVYLNWEYAKGDEGLTLANAAAGASASDTMPLSAETEPQELAAQGEATSGVADKNYGDAQLVSAGSDTSEKYFEQARLTRSKTRDDALDKLQKALKNAKLTKEEKKAATDTLTSTIENITKEADIENMVKAKGFVDCVSFIEGDKINIAVKTGGSALGKSEVAQIRDIVLGKIETAAKNITIVEVK
ncbi:MAG: SpoIIIAH-like family protein [Oscillospiraceae bacterium]